MRLILTVSICFVLFGLLGCTKQNDPALTPVEKPLSSSIAIKSIQPIEISSERNDLAGVQYDVILAIEDIPGKKMSELGFGLELSGKMQQIWGRSGSGIQYGYRTLEASPSDRNRNIMVSFTFLRSGGLRTAFSANELDYSLSSTAIRNDLKVVCYDNEQFAGELNRRTD